MLVADDPIRSGEGTILLELGIAEVDGTRSCFNVSTMLSFAFIPGYLRVFAWQRSDYGDLYSLLTIDRGMRGACLGSIPLLPEAKVATYQFCRNYRAKQDSKYCS